MTVVISGNTYEVIDGNYHLVATYGLAAQISGMVPVGIENQLLTAEYVTNTGCQLVSNPILNYTSDTMCVLYEDLEVDEDIMIDGDETHTDYTYCKYSSINNGEIIIPNDVSWIEDYGNEKDISSSDVHCKNVYGDLPTGAYSGLTNLKTFKTASEQNIGSNCFKGCTGLKTVEITGDGYSYDGMSISTSAFEGCTNLKNVIIGTYWYDGNPTVNISTNAFKYCSRLTRLQGQDRIKSIGSSAFQGCSALTTLTLVNCSSIGQQAFGGCTNLKRIIVRGDATFNNNSPGIFYGCPNIEEVIFRGDAGSGGWKTMLNNLYNGLSQTAKSNFVVRVENRYESGYTADTSVDWFDDIAFLNENDIILGNYEQTMSDGSGHTITDGNGVWTTSVAFNWLKYNTRCMTIFEARDVNTVNIYSNDIVYREFNEVRHSSLGIPRRQSISYSYSGEDGRNYILKDFTCFKHFTNITEIENIAFNECYNLSAITIPSGITSIGNSAFEGCRSLKSIATSNVENIGSCAFSGCTSLSSVTLTNTVSNIDSDAFSGCTNLQRVTISNLNATVSYDAFNGCPATGTAYYKQGEDYTTSDYYSTRLSGWTWTSY